MPVCLVVASLILGIFEKYLIEQNYIMFCIRRENGRREQEKKTGEENGRREREKRLGEENGRREREKRAGEENGRPGGG